jgi:outer membrane biosynthesis protein TonB
MTRAAAFSQVEVVAAAAFGLIVEIALFVLLAFARNTAHIQAREEPTVKEAPIEVKPVLDETPLLKLGGKRVKTKLPDMWVKKPPIKRYKAVSAPTPKAEQTVDKIPDTKTDPTAKPPPPDAAIAKEVDESIPETDEKPEEEQNVDEEGAADGVKEGTEADPLKAMAVNLYMSKIVGWFNARFKAPTEIPCEELKKLKASVSATVGGDRSVTGYTITKPSGNEVFDAKVRQTMDGIVGSHAELPPPPPNYPDILQSTVFPSFSRPRCE